MAQQLHFEITTPERTVYQADVDQVTVPTATGEVTILPNHIPLVSQLVPGELVVKRGAELTHVAISGGFLEVRPGSQVVVLADSAEKVEEIDVKRAEEARAKAKAAMEVNHQDTEKFAEATAGLERALARLKVVKRTRHRGHHGVGSEGVLEE